MTLNDLTGENVMDGTVGSQTQRLKAAKAAPMPLEEASKERVLRKVAYSKNKKEISRYQPIVEQHNLQKTLNFPLKPEIRSTTSNASLATTLKVPFSLFLFSFSLFLFSFFLFFSNTAYFFT